MPAATAAADPPEDPPGTRSGASGFFAGPNALCSVEDPMANSSMFDFATMIAPASLSLRTAVAGKALTYPSRILDPHDVGRTDVAMLSFTTTGTPLSGRARIAGSSASHVTARVSAS